MAPYEDMLNSGLNPIRSNDEPPASRPPEHGQAPAIAARTPATGRSVGAHQEAADGAAVAVVEREVCEARGEMAREGVGA